MPKDIKKKSKPKPNKEKQKVLDALNRIDELACAYTTDNNMIDELGIGEAELLEKDYNLVFDYITKQ
jgi:hypothetical protein